MREVFRTTRVKRVAGETWEEAVHNHIFTPLGMFNTNATLEELKNSPNFSQPYAEVDNVLVKVPFHHVEGVEAGGALNSNIEDMVKWVQFQLLDEQFQEGHTIQMPIAPGKLNLIGISQLAYGLGWFIGEYKDHAIINHSGGIDGFNSDVSLIPEKKIGIVILSNSGTDGRYAIAAIRNTVLDKLLETDVSDWIEIANEKRNKNKEKLIFEVNPEIAPSRPLEEYVGIYEHPAYGPVRVDIKNKQLFAFYGEEIALYPECEDAFKGQIRSLLLFGYSGATDFLFGPGEVRITFEPEAPPLLFRKIMNSPYDREI